MITIYTPCVRRLAVLVTLCVTAAAINASAQDEPPTTLPPALLKTSPLGEKIELLRPEQPRDEKEADRLHAAKLFAHGRMLQNREDYAGALQRFERAWRYHPQQVSILDAIVPLAFELKRNGEAARYAVIAAERNPKDPDLVRRLAMYLAQQEDYQRAAALYEQAIALEEPGKLNGDRLMLRMELGRLYLLIEDYERSAAAFTEPANALANPDSYDLTEEQQRELLGKPQQTYLVLGESFLRGGRHDQAEQAFRKAHEAEPNQPLLDFSLARVAKSKGNPQQALELLEKYFATNASLGGMEPYQEFAEIVAATADSEESARKQVIARLQPLQQGDPANAGLGVFLAQQLAADQQWQASESIYTELLKISPSLEAFNGLIALQHRRREIPKLLDALGQAVAVAGEFEPLEESTAAILKDQQLLTDLLQEAQSRFDKDPEKLGEGVALAAGLLAMEAKAFDQVKPFMQRALAEGVPAASAIVSQWGLGMLMADQHEAAAEVFQAAIADKVDEENNAAYYFYLASALGMAEKFDEGLAAARKAAELRPIARFKSRIPWLQYYAKRYDEAAKGYQQILDEYGDVHDDSNTRDVIRDARLVLSTVALKQGDFDKAVEQLERVLDEFPEDIGARNDLGYLWADENVHLQRAHGMLQEAVTAEPDNLAYRDSLGWVLFRLGRLDEALAELEIAAEEEDPDGVILDHLADATWAAGKHDEARKLWQRAIEAFEKSKEPDSVKEVREKLDRKP